MRRNSSEAEVRRSITRRKARTRRPATACSTQATIRMTTMRPPRVSASRASSSSPYKYERKSLMQAQRSFDVADHGHEARPEIVLERAFLRHERRHAAVERDDLAVHGAAHRHAHGVDLAAQLAHRGAEAARADVLQRLVDRRPVLAVRLGLLDLHLVEHRL